MSTQTYDSPVPSPDPAVTYAWARRCALAEMGAELAAIGAARYEESAVASDATTTQVQELEFALGEGPAHTAIGSGRLVMADEVAMRARWPLYAAAVAELGVRSVDQPHRAREDGRQVPRRDGRVATSAGGTLLAFVDREVVFE